MVSEKSAIVGAILVLGVFVFSLSFASAVVTLYTVDGAGNNIAQGNFSNSSLGGPGNATLQVIFNVTFANGTDTNPFGAADSKAARGTFNMTTINATFWRQNGTSWYVIGNSSTCELHNATTGIACWGVINITFESGGDNGGIDSLYNFTAELINGTNSTLGAGNINLPGANTSTNISGAYDVTPPAVLAVNITSIVAHSNYSDAFNGTVLVNISLSDATTKVVQVLANITNVTNGLTLHGNGSLNLSREGTSTWWSATFNTTNLPDGHYNVTIWAWDHTINNRTSPHPAGLRGNVNNTVLITNITIDNTAPTVSLSCTPNPVTEDNTLTCSCTGDDDGNKFAATGIKSTSFTTNPTTANSGSFSTGCSTADYVGHEVSTTFAYTVSEAGASGGSSGSSGSSSSSSGTGTVIWKTYPVDAKEFTSGGGISRSVGKNERLKVSVEDEDHTVGVTAIGVDSVTFEISSMPQSATLNIGDTKKFEVSEDGFYDIQVTLDGISGGKADITILSIHEEIPADELAEIERQREEAAGGGDNIPPEDSGKSNKGLIIGLIVVALVIIGIIVAVVKKKK